MPSANHAELYKTRRWQAFRLTILERDLFTCQMCGCIVTSGRTSPRAAVADHLIPVELRPDLFFDPDNVRTVCKRDHDGPCASIESMFDNADQIKAEKLAYVIAGYDSQGKPTSPNHPWNARAV